MVREQVEVPISNLNILVIESMHLLQNAAFFI